MPLKLRSPRAAVETLEGRQLFASSAALTTGAPASASPVGGVGTRAGHGSAVTQAAATAVAQRSVYLTGNSLTDGINYAGLASLLNLDGGTVTWGRQTGSGYTQAANLNLRAGYLTGGYDPARPTVSNPWGNYQQAFAATKWDALTLQPQERSLVNEVFNAGTTAEQNEAEVPISLAFLRALAANNPGGQAYIYERPARRTDVRSDLSATGDTEHYSETWLQTYNDSAAQDQPFFSRSFFQQLMPLLRSAESSDPVTAGLPPVKIIPVGEAYYRVDQMLRAGAFNGTAVTSMLDMYRDQSHPSADLASYVIALTFYSSITGNDPRGIPPPAAYLFQGSRLSDPKVQTLLQQAVYDAITAPAYAGYATTLPDAPPLQGQILASAYVDANSNSAFDAGEQPLPNLTVFLDTNANGLFDAGEASQITDANGLATFTGLSAGNYVVRSVPLSNYDVTAAFPPVALDGTSIKTVASGLAQKVPTGTGLPTGNSTLSGSVVEDTNHDRVWSYGEAAIPNRTVWIDLNDDGIMQDREPRTLTNGVGKFTFKVPAGNYRLREVIPAGWVQELPTANTSFGFSVVDGGTKSISFLGYTLPKPTNVGQIAVTVYNDADSNAAFNAGDVAMAGVAVYLDANGNGQYDAGELTQTTSASGVATFTGLGAGTYSVRTVPQTGFVFITPQPLSIVSDGSSAAAALIGLAPEVAGREVITVFSDANTDGVQTAGEAGISYVTLYLDANSNGQFDSGELSAVSDATGAATFDRLLAGTYTMRAILPSGYRATTPLPLTITSNGESTVFAALGLAPAPVAAGREVVNVFNDPNGTGAPGPGATAASGITLYLDANNNAQLDAGEATAVSDAGGAATFAQLAAGAYAVRAVVPSGYHATTPLPLAFSSDGVSSGSVAFGIAADPIVVPPPADPDSVTIEAEAATVSGGTWVTTNHANYAGTGFADYGGDGSAVQWSVARLAAGTVTLNFRYANGGATARPLTVYVNGLAVGSVTMPSTGSWDTWKVAAIGVTLSAGVNSIKAVAGPATGANVDSLTIVRNPNNPVPAGTISGFAYVDADGNGVYDHADTRVAGMQVYLDTNANGVLDTGETFVVTASDGSYGFANVTPGTYAVGEVPPGGYVPATATPPVTVAAGQAVSNVILPLKPASPTIDPSVVTIEGEAGTGTGGTFSARNHTGFTGNGFLDFGGSGSAGQWTIARNTAGAATLTFRYANGGNADRPLTIYVNGAVAGLLSMPATGSWDLWKNATIGITLTAGLNTIRAVAGDATGGNIDSLAITTP